MSKTSHENRVYFSVAWGLAGFALAWLLLGVLDLPRFWYDPLAREWSFQVAAPSGVAMGWYGALLWGVVLGEGVGWVGYFTLGRVACCEGPLASESRPPRCCGWHLVAAVITAGLVLLCLGFYVATRLTNSSS